LLLSNTFQHWLQDAPAGVNEPSADLIEREARLQSQARFLLFSGIWMELQSSPKEKKKKFRGKHNQKIEKANEKNEKKKKKKKLEKKKIIYLRDGRKATSSANS
jgi:hypothetical protein